MESNLERIQNLIVRSNLITTTDETYEILDKDGKLIGVVYSYEPTQARSIVDGQKVSWKIRRENGHFIKVEE